MAQTSPRNPDLMFFWTEGRTPKGQKSRSGEIKAQSEHHARYLLRKQGIQYATMKKVKPQKVSGRVPLAVVSAFIRQLSVMIQSGVPLAQSLGLIAGNMNTKKTSRMREIVRTIRADVESGLRLSDAFRKHPACFDAIFCNTLAAGEESGELDSVLMRLANHLEKAIRTRQKIRKAMTYPAIVVLVAVAVSCGLLMFVIPTFRNIYTSFKAELPALTQTLLGLSDLLTEQGPLVLLGLVSIVLGIRAAYKKFEPFRDRLDSLLLRLPLVGELLRTAIFARWTRTFSTLSASGVPIVDALDSVAHVSGHHTFRNSTLLIRQEVATGISVSDSMEKTGVFQPEATQMIKIGEESGRLDAMLERLAIQYETHLDDMVDNLSTLMEPLIMCVIGGIVGVLIIGMYMPIFQLGGVF